MEEFHHPKLKINNQAVPIIKGAKMQENAQDCERMSTANQTIANREVMVFLKTFKNQ